MKSPPTSTPPPWLPSYPLTAACTGPALLTTPVTAAPTSLQTRSSALTTAHTSPCLRHVTGLLRLEVPPWRVAAGDHAHTLGGSGTRVRAWPHQDPLTPPPVLRCPLVLHAGPVERPSLPCDVLPVRCRDQPLHMRLVVRPRCSLSPRAVAIMPPLVRTSGCGRASATSCQSVSATTSRHARTAVRGPCPAP